MTESTQQSTHNKPPRLSGRRKRQLKLAAIVTAVVVIVGWGGKWIYHRFTHVTVSDAHVAAHEITVSSRLAGRVTGFDLIEGDRLQQGATVAQLYKRPDQLRLDELNARIARIKAELALARKQIGGGVASAKAQLAADTAAMHAAKARVGKARENYHRARRLYQAHGGTQKQRDIDRYDYHAAQADYQRARHRVHMDQVAVANARTGLLGAGLISNPQVLKARLKMAKAQRAHQQNRINDLTVKSPIHGVVDKTFIEQNEYVSPGQPIVMMHDPGDVWIEADIKETEIHDIRVGQPVAIHVDARPDTTYTGHVQVIGDAATNQFALLPNPNPSGNFTKITQRLPVRIAIDHGPKTKLAPGMMVEADIDITAPGSSDRRSQQKPIATRSEQLPQQGRPAGQH